jgi:hypothetical protein
MSGLIDRASRGFNRCDRVLANDNRLADVDCAWNPDTLDNEGLNLLVVLVGDRLRSIGHARPKVELVIGADIES